MTSVALINDEKIEVERTSVYVYKNRFMEELDIESVKRINPELCPEVLNQKTNLVFETRMPETPYNAAITEISSQLYFLIYDPISFCASSGIPATGASIGNKLEMIIGDFNKSYNSLTKKYSMETINYIIKYLKNYLDACCKYPEAKIKIIR